MGTILSILLVVSYFLLVLYTWRIAAATKKYAEVTERLLELNKQSSDESRKGYVIDVIGMIVYRAMDLKASTNKVDYLQGYIKGAYEAIKDIDPDLADDVKKGLISWGEKQGEGRTTEQFLFGSSIRQLLERK